MAQLGGTLFIDRQRRMHVGEINDDIQTALDDGALVIVFPEGTSSDGQSVLPFKSSLLQPATPQQHPLTIGRVHYTLPDGCPDAAVAEIVALGDAEFLALLQQRFGTRHRFIAASPRTSYPLGLRYRWKPVGERQVWLGNAATETSFGGIVSAVTVRIAVRLGCASPGTTASNLNCRPLSASATPGVV